MRSMWIRRRRPDPAECFTRPRVAGFVLLAVLATRGIAGDGPPEARFWPAWRGPLGTGTAPHADPPVEWSETENIRWRLDIPGKGHSTPIVWDDRIMLTTAVPTGDSLGPIFDQAPGSHDNVPVTHRYRFVVLAYAVDDGALLWEKTVAEALPHEGGHYTGSLASPSPVTDGERVYASFGSRGIHALDIASGEILWKRDLGELATKHAHGEGASPLLRGSFLVANWDHEGASFIVALDTKNGEERWRAPRDEVTSWATPIAVEHDGRTQVVVSGTNRVRGYDLETGKVIWECGGLSHNVVASPVAGDGMVFAASSYETRRLIALRLDGAKGDITGSDRIAWTRTRGTPYVPSLLLYDRSLYFLSHYQGILTRVDAKTGVEPHSPIRLRGLDEIYSSPVAAAGRIYVTSRTGVTAVIRHGATPRVLAENKLDDIFSASAVAVGERLYLRGERHLYAIEKKPD